jgi:hypothetical protein
MSKVGNETKADMGGAMSELGGNTRRGAASGSGSKVGNETKANMAGAMSEGSSVGSSVVGLTGMKQALGELHSQHPPSHDSMDKVHHAASAHDRHMPLHGLRPTGGR